MSWEDITIAMAVLVLTLTVIPMIRSHFTPPLATSGPMVVCMVALIVAYVSLGLWFSVAVEFTSVALWGVLLTRGLRA